MPECYAGKMFSVTVETDSEGDIVIRADDDHIWISVEQAEVFINMIRAAASSARKIKENADAASKVEE